MKYNARTPDFIAALAWSAILAAVVCEQFPQFLDTPSSECELRFSGNRARVAIAIRQKLVLVLLSTVPDRADGVDHELRRQIETGSDAGLASWASAELFAGFIELMPGGNAVAAPLAGSENGGAGGGVGKQTKRRRVQNDMPRHG